MDAASNRRLRIATLFTLALGLLAPKAQAYSYESLVTTPCHERITGDAWRQVRSEPRIRELTQPTAPDRDLRSLIADLPFRVGRDMRDIGSATLLIGVRDNDLKGNHALDALELAEIHGDARTQREHCLRRPEHDEPEGSAAAVAECRAYIRETALHAIRAGLDPEGRPDVARRTIVGVYLSARRQVEADLPIFYMYMGNALHALQDSFSHTLRRDVAGGGSAVTVVLSFSELASGDHDERRDGPAHMVLMDECEDLDAYRTARLALARDASTELLRVVLEPASAEDKERALDAVLDKWLTHAPGCTYENRWCDAAELRYRDPGGCQCGSPGGAGGGLAALLGALGVLGALVSRRARDRRRLRQSVAGSITIAIVLAATPSSAAPPTWGAASADADDDPAANANATTTAAEPTPPSPLACVPGRQLACACPEGDSGAQTCRDDGSGFGTCDGCAPRAASHSELLDAAERERPVRSRLGAYGAIGGALEDPALAFSFAGRYHVNRRWMLGADIESNPWISAETKRIRPGTLNAYFTLIRRFIVNEDIAIRTTAHVGVSVLTFDLYGATAGSFGPYLGLNLIGLEVALSRSWKLVVDPADLVYTVPHIVGVPILHRQYRFTIGLQFGL